MFTDLPELTIDNIVSRLDYLDIISLCSVSAPINKYCKQSRFWRYLYNQKFPKLSLPEYLDLTWQDLYRIHDRREKYNKADDSLGDEKKDWINMDFDVIDIDRDEEYDFTDETYRGLPAKKIIRKLKDILTKCGKTSMKVNDIFVSLGYTPDFDLFVGVTVGSKGGYYNPFDTSVDCVVTLFSLRSNAQIKRVYGCYLPRDFLRKYYSNPYKIYGLTESPLRALRGFLDPPPNTFIKHINNVEREIRAKFKDKLNPKQRKIFDYELKKTFNQLKQGKVYCNEKWATEEEIKNSPPKYIFDMYKILLENMIYGSCWMLVIEMEESRDDSED